MPERLLTPLLAATQETTRGRPYRPALVLLREHHSGVSLCLPEEH